MGEWGDARNGGLTRTNFFPDEQRMSPWCHDGTFYGARTECTQFFLHDCGAFANLFFLTRQPRDLAADLARLVDRLTHRRVIADVVGPDEIRVALVDSFLQAGFQQVAELRRMGRCTPTESLPLESDASSATEGDIPVIQHFFAHHFNAEVEQLPTEAELAHWISRDELLVRRERTGQLAGFVIFDLTPASLYLRYWFVAPEARGTGVGGALMRTMFVRAAKTKRQYLWVLSDNQAAIIRYQHYGFSFEAMKDCVMATGERR